MSIVRYILKGELPKEGQVVYCDNGEFSPDRAVYRDGEFIGGGEYPVPSYKMSNASKWFDLKDYSDFHRCKGISCYSISFDVAEGIDIK